MDDPNTLDPVHATVSYAFLGQAVVAISKVANLGMHTQLVTT